MSTPQVQSTPSSLAKRALAAVLTAGLAVGLVFTSGVAVANAAEPDLVVTGLRTDGRVNPLGIGLSDPTFSWYNTATSRGTEQTGYELEVSKASDVVWSTGRVNDDEQLNVVYDGPALTDQSRYSWRVKTWDNHENESAWSDAAWFETGLSTWTGDWISAPSNDAELARWNDYTVTTNFTLDANVIGVYFRGVDTRSAYMWQLNTSDGTNVMFRPHKAINGGIGLIESKNVSNFISRAALLTGTHELKISAIGSTITTWVDGIQIDQRTESQRLTGYVGFRQAPSQQGPERATIHDMSVVKPDGTVLFSSTFDGSTNPFTVGRVANGNLIFDADGDGFLNTAKNLPIFRKEFTPDAAKTVASARIYAAARGVYELSLNGEKVGDQHLAPGWTNYNSRIQYQTYDVTDQLDGGANAIGAYLAPGWYSGNIASFGNNKYGNTPSLIAQLRIDYTDGSSEWVSTNNTWKTTSGPIKSSDIIDGETFDASATPSGWDHAGFDATAWSAPGIQPTASSKLTPQLDEPVRQTEEKPAKSMTQTVSGRYVYDLEQNMVGVARLRLTGVAGQTVKIRYGEVVNPDKSLYVANLRSAKVTDYYTFKTTGVEVYEPKFTYHGYRFIEVSGVTTVPALTDITGLVWGSDMETTGTLETSNALLNQLQSNITWGQRGNFLSIPTDTPARDERLGWTGDINVFAQTAAYNSNTHGFLSKWLIDLKETQGSNGDLPGVAPYTDCCGGGVGWSDAGITVPYSLFKAYGDTAVVRDNWDMMDKFMDYVIAEAGADNIGTRGAYLDWLHLDDPTAANVLSTAYNAEDARMLSEMAAAIGETARAEELAQLSLDIRAAFASAFIAANGTVSGNSQTGYAMALGMGMVPADKVQAVGDKFIAKLAVTDYHLTTGFLGTPWLLPALTASGHNDIAYRMLLHTDYPSWGYEVANGATTIWERWNSIMPDGSFGDVNMNSFNHYAYGAVGTWMYQNIGGIAPLSEGYKTFRIAPVVGGGLTSGTGEFASVYGDISSKWETTDNGLTLDVTVPVGTTATVELPANSEWAVSEGGKLLDQVEGVTDVTSTDGLVTVTVGSGTYEFVVDERGATLGAVFVALDSYRAEIARLEGLGDLSAGQADAFEESLDGIATSVETALLAIIESGDILSPLLVAVDDVAALETEVSAAGLDDTVEGLLLDENDAVDSLLGSVVSQLLGVSAAIAPVAGSPLAGDDVEAAVSLANTGTAAVTDLSATIAIEGGWSVEPARLERATLAANSTGSLAFATTVPSDAEVGQVDATLDLAYRYGTHEIHVSSTSRLLTVASPIAISTATAAVTSAGTAEVTVVVANTGSTGVSGRVELDVPEGWAAAIPSSDVTVGANDTATIVVPLFVPATVNEQSFTIGTSFVRGGTILDERDAALAVALTRSPADPIDWVDLGNPTAEASRAILHSGNSGTNTEAGLTRRYSNATTPGSWFSFTITVPVNQPYVIRATETYDSVATKKYDIKIDGQTVYTRQNTSKGAGTQTFDALVTTPSATSTVRLEMRYTTEPGFHDPSIADVWTLAAPADLAPLTSANVTSSGPTGANGWVRGPATVTVNAADDSGIAPTLEVDAGAGWGAYTAPVTVTAQGTTTIGYRATDANSHVTARKDATVKLDSIAPTTTALTEVSAEVASLDHATVTFTATDATSGVAATRYRIDGGSWATASAEPISIEGFGEHLVEYYSTDVAGNVGLIERAEVSIDDVDGVAALVAPVVSGTAKFGKTLSTTTGLWNTTGLTFSYQWLRNGIEISNATASSYVVRSNDGGKKVSVRVTATKTGLAAGVAVSNSTATVPKVTLLKNTKRATITGSAKPGSTLKAGKGSWNVKSLSYSYQWYRNSVAIDGATASSYKVTVADSGAKITVKVGASKSLYEPVYSTAVSKVIVKRAAVTSFTAYPTTVASGAVSTLAITVASNGLVPTGTVAIYDGSKKIGSVALVDGTATYEFSSTKKGSHALLAKYLGSTQIAADSSVRRTIRVN